MTLIFSCIKKYLFISFSTHIMHITASVYFGTFSIIFSIFHFDMFYTRSDCVSRLYARFFYLKCYAGLVGSGWFHAWNRHLKDSYVSHAFHAVYNLLFFEWKLTPFKLRWKVEQESDREAVEKDLRRWQNQYWLTRTLIWDFKQGIDSFTLRTWVMLSTSSWNFLLFSFHLLWIGTSNI